MAGIPEIHFATLDDCHQAAGLVVVIDVCRAFTTAAYAFGSGARQILLAGTVEEALALRGRTPGALLTGESGGMPVEGFDFWNSPVQMHREDLHGKTLVQRTSAGVQGVVRARQAGHLLAGSFAVAKATVRAVWRRMPATVTFVVTGAHEDDPRYGLEDRACAEYMAALLRGEPADPQDFLQWKQDFVDVHRLGEADPGLREHFLADVALAMLPDQFSFAMPIYRRDGLLVMEEEYDPVP